MTPAWRVAAALALACRLDWGRWERSKFPDPNCDACWGRGGERDGDVPDQWYPCECLRPVPDPSDGAAYLADCARRGVEPGPLPSLEYTTRHVAWVVTVDVDGTIDYVAVRVGGIEMSTHEDHPQWSACQGSICSAADLALLSTLVTAAASALEAAPAPAPDRAPTSREVMAAAQRAKQEVESWPAWKRTLSEPEPDACTHPKDRRIATYDEPGAFTCVACGLSVSTLSPTAATPREKLRRDLDANAKRWASYPAEVRAVISTAEVFAVASPAEPAAPDPWALPEPLYWRFLPSRGWSISSRNDDGGWALRPDADYLVVLLRKRNADEPDGPACWACGSCGCRNPKGPTC